MVNLLLFIIQILIFIQPALAQKQEVEMGWSTGLSQNVIDSFSGSNLLLHAAGMASTPLIIQNGVDARVRDNFRHDKNLAALPGAVLASGAGALIAATSLYYTGKNSGNWETMGAAYVIGQASVITVSYVIMLKALTGRAHPTNKWHLSSQEQSEQWQFGFMRNGPTSYGWPSGHVSHTVAVTSALAHYYPEKFWLKTFGMGLSTYMLYTIVAHDSGQMHWFSDGVAGAFMGYAIGSTVGKNFRARIDGTQKESSNYEYIPVVSSNYFGAVASISF